MCMNRKGSTAHKMLFYFYFYCIQVLYYLNCYIYPNFQTKRLSFQQYMLKTVIFHIHEPTKMVQSKKDMSI